MSASPPRSSSPAFDIDYALIFNASSNGMAFSEFESGRILDVNAAWTGVTGIAREDWIGHTALELGVWANVDERCECVGRLRRDGVVRDFAADLVLRGCQVPHLISVQRVHTSGLDCTLWEFRNIAAARQAEQALRDSELKYRTLADHSPLAIQVFAPDGGTRWVNKTWERMWQADLAAMVRYNVLEDQQLVELGIRPLLDRAFAGESVEFPIHCYDRTRVQEVDSPDGALWVRAFAYPVKGPDGQPLEVVVIQEDVTARVIAETDLIAAKDAAASAARAKSQFLAHMSHEIRTPLNAVLGLAQLLQAGVDPAEQTDIVRNINVAGKALLDIVNEILDYSKIEAGQLRLENRPFHIADVIERVDRMLRGIAAGKGLVLRFEPLALRLPRLVGDAQRLEQVLVNLVSNAIKFTERGEVTVSIAATPATSSATTAATSSATSSTIPPPTSAGAGAALRLRFEVRDTGIGIAPDVLGGLFTAFSQGEAGITRRFGGTGLGLAISKRLVEVMGGQLGVVSAPGEGSCFWFDSTFAVAASDDARAGAGDASTARFTQQRLAGLRVLAVDDNRLNLDVVQRLLAREGAGVAPAGDGRQALQLLEAQPTAFDVVLMDIQMPVMDGLSATRAIRADPLLASLPVFALTAGVLPDERTAAIAAGIDGFLAKPIDLRALVDALVHLVPPP